MNDIEEARSQAMSFAAYRIIRHRFRLSPRASLIRRDADALLGALGYDPDGDDRTTAFGNGIAQCYIDFGLVDGANEADDYANVSYEPVNPPLEPGKPGNPDIVDLNRWQPLQLEAFIDQAGNPVTEDPEFLSPEWGIVVPFALAEADRTVYRRDDFDYWVYHDPGMPPTIDGTLGDDYRWSHALVAIWSSHLDPADGATMDISPASLGHIEGVSGTFRGSPVVLRPERRRRSREPATNSIPPPVNRTLLKSCRGATTPGCWRSSGPTGRTRRHRRDTGS